MAASQTSRKPKIALMSYTMDNRRGMGTAIYTRRLIEEMLQDTRFTFYLVHFDAVDDPLYSRAHEILMPRITLPLATRFMRTLMFFWKYRNDRFDIIHWFQPRLYPFFWLAPANRIVVTAHGAADVTAPGTFVFSRSVFNFLMIHANRWIGAIIAVSEFGKREIIEWYRAKPEKVFVTYPGGGERFAPMSRKEAESRVREIYGITGQFILDVSRLEPHKNVHRLIEAYIAVRERGITHKLVVVGKDNGDSEGIRAFARSSRFAGDIIFIQHSDGADLNSLYAAADVFAFPSLNEGFGLPLVEAMSVGTPVIASNVTALPEIVGPAGVCVDPLDTGAIANALSRLLQYPALRKKLSDEGLKRAPMFFWKRTAKDTIRIYERLLEGVQ